MVKKLDWRKLKGFKVRWKAAIRCLRYKQFVLVCWTKCEDGDLNFRISHKGCEISEAAHRLKVDAAEILQDIQDQNLALEEVDNILSK